MKSLIDYYDDYAESWADRWYPNETLLPYLKEFLSYLPQEQILPILQMTKLSRLVLRN